MVLVVVFPIPMWIQLNLQIKNHIWQKHWDKYLIDYQSENLVLHIHTWWWLQIWDRPTCISYLRMHALYTEDLYVHLSNSIASYIILGSYSSGLFLAKFSDTRPRTCWYILPGTDWLMSLVLLCCCLTCHFVLVLSDWWGDLINILGQHMSRNINK